MKVRWAVHRARMEEDRSDFKIPTGKPAGKRPLGRPRHRFEEDNIRTGFKETGISPRNFIDSAQDKDYWRAIVNAATSGLRHGNKEMLWKMGYHEPN